MKALRLTQPMENATLHMRVEQTAGFKVRLAVGLLLIRFAVRVMGGKTEIEMRTSDGE